MSREASEGWVERRVRAAMKGEMDRLRAELTALAEAADADRAEMRERTAALRAEMADQGADLRAMIHNVAMEISRNAAHAEEGLSALRAAMDGDARVEKLRLRVEALLAQHRWDTDQLQRAVTALAERLPLEA